MKIIANIQNGYNSRFGIPRQSGLVKNESMIVFKPQYRDPDALRGLEGFSHLWIIWEFSEAKTEKWKPTVRPPKLGGNTRVGVFATRSPFRPNPIGLSCVKINSIIFDSELGPVITVIGADLMNGTPIYDIKPYIPFTDSKTDAVGGFSDEYLNEKLEVSFSDDIASILSLDEKLLLTEILEQDPRPAYHDNADRIYAFEYGDFHIKFTVKASCLIVIELTKIK